MAVLTRIGAFFAMLISLQERVFGMLERVLKGWFLGLLARFIFAAVLSGYYWNSALTKVGDGVLGFFSIDDAAYFQIVPPVVEAAGYDASAVATVPWGLMVAAGTYGEFVLPILLVIGLFGRVAALGMIMFVLVQSYVDIAFHGADAATIGALFDRLPNSTIMDQRALWMVPLLYLVVKGPGWVSVDGLLLRLRNRAAHAAAHPA